MMKRITECTKCGGKSGLFSKETAKYDQYYDFNGIENGYSDLDRELHRGNTNLYCLDCGKVVTTLEALLRRTSHAID